MEVASVRPTDNVRRREASVTPRYPAFNPGPFRPLPPAFP